jgi:hypothetical protein
LVLLFSGGERGVFSADSFDLFVCLVYLRFGLTSGSSFMPGDYGPDFLNIGVIIPKLAKDTLATGAFLTLV